MDPGDLASIREHCGGPRHRFLALHAGEDDRELPDGYATIYGGYRKNYRRCPDESPQAFTARVHIGDLVIAVNPIPVEPPGPPGFPRTFFIETGNPYGSFKGMEAIARGLRLRPKPVY